MGRLAYGLEEGGGLARFSLPLCRGIRTPFVEWARHDEGSKGTIWRNQGYEDCDFVFLDAAGKEYFHAAWNASRLRCAGQGKTHLAAGDPGGVATLLDSLRPLEQAC